jgi:uncharacterized protein with NRDE domain
MCLIVLAYRVHPQYPVVIAANRDEFYARPTSALGEWSDDARIVAGRDLEGGGTWLGVHRNGRIAALTNYREPGIRISEAPSRGHLVRDFLSAPINLNQYMNNINLTKHHYNGFNLLLYGDGQWVYTSNRSPSPETVRPGIHGLSNHLLNTPWPKVIRSCRAVEKCLSRRRRPDIEELMHVLEDRRIPSDDELPQTGVGLEWERRLGSIFIQSDIYGTRAATVLLADKDGAVRIRERSYDQNGSTGEIEYQMQIPGA